MVLKFQGYIIHQELGRLFSNGLELFYHLKEPCQLLVRRCDYLDLLVRMVVGCIVLSWGGFASYVFW